jgi:teichuronic acid exporter
MSCIGILQASLINSQGHAGWWFYYLAAKQVVTALIILALYRFGVTVLVLAIALQNLVMWPASVAMVLRILRIGLAAYMRPFLAPAVASAVMLAGVMAIQRFGPQGSDWLHLTSQVAGGTLTYCLVLFALDSARILQMRDLVMKRRAVAA